MTYLQFLRLPWARSLGWSLLHFCWQGTLVAILLAIVLGALRGRSAQIRYGVACFALVVLLTLPFATFARLSAQVRPVEALSNTSLGGIRLLNSDRSAGITEPWVDRLTRRLDQSMPWLLSLWFMGVMILVGRLNLGLVAAERLRSAATQPAVEELQEALRELSLRLGVKRSLKLMNSALVEVPTVLGWLQPVILVPLGCLAGLSASQVQALLAHELAHIRRQDYLVNIFQSAVETLLFYHPAVWWVSKQVRQEREHCCDDLAVRISGDTLAYAKALSILEERRASVPVAALGSNGGALTMRIRRLLGCPEPPAISRWLAIPFLAVVLIAGGLCVGTLAHAAGQQANVKESAELKDLPPEYQKWLEKEVVWIITPEERAAFSQLKTNEERDMFVEQFWLRRNPTPNSKENPFKEEHYRRLAFANLHFAAKNTPGWKTDRGRIYIVYGPPDQINSYPAGDSSASGKPTDIWTYRLIREHGRDRKDVVMQFVDVNGDGEYPLQSPGKKD